MSTPDQTGRKAWWEILAVLTPLILGFAVTGTGLLFTHIYNQRQLQLNQITSQRQLQLNQITLLDKYRNLLTSTDPFDREFAYASFVALGYEDLAIKLVKIKQDVAGKDIVREVRSTGSPAARAEATAALSTLPTQIYIHIASKDQRQRAAVLREALEGKGYIVPGIEDVSAKADLPRKANVRYFNDEDKQTAQAIAEVMKQQGVSSVSAYKIGGYKVKPGSLEVWFSPSD